jgi:predicted AlkP superfamily phosphohydrolase/phosphomutase
MLVVGVDGGEWSVIRRLWAAGELPALAALAERGASAGLATDYGASPVIWTTIATGRRPRQHGITDFVVAGPAGDVPVSSAVRRVPALWNMLTTAGRRVAVVGWWASWPAEEVAGVVVSDRALLGVPDAVYPPEAAAAVEAERRAAMAAPEGFDPGDAAQLRDRVTSGLARRLAADLGRPGGYDLLLVYFRSPDVVSHHDWRWFEPEAFPPADPAPTPAEAAERADRIPRVYRAFDRALGVLVAAAPADTNLLVVSDHGFRAADGEEVQLLFDLDAVLEPLGQLARADGGAVDFAATRVFSYRAPQRHREKTVRFAQAGREPGGRVLPREVPGVRAELERDLARVRWPGGEPVFSVRDARPRERREGADLVVVVRRHGAAERVLVDGEPFAAPVEQLSRITGTHHRHTSGIFLAAGPDLRPDAPLDGIGIHDLAPTVLYGLGLPVGEDFAGRAWVELYTGAFRRRHPPVTVTTWGTRTAGAAATSDADQQLLDELGALGYLD